MRGGELDREIEHRDGHVEAFDREPLLAEVGFVEEALECVHGGQTREQLLLAIGGKRPAMLAGFDHLPQPQALFVAADVFDLVGNGTAVCRAQRGQCVRECLTRHVDPQHLCRDPRHDLRRESEPADVERRIAGRLAAERVEVRGEVAEISMGSDQSIRRSDIL